MVEQLDGLGLVYEKQGNTGAAAYEQSNRVDPFARVTNQLAFDLQREQRKIEVEQEKKDKLNFQVLEGLGDIKGWEIDNQATIYNEANELKNEASQLITEGINLTDLANPKARAFQEKRQKLQQKAQLSGTQGPTIDAMRKDLFKNPQKYDVEETTKALKAYEAMTPSERLEIPAETLFVPKFNRYALVPKSSQIQNFVNISPKGGTTIDNARLDEFMKLQFATEEGQKAYELGLQKGEWASPEEYIKTNKDYLVSQVKNKSDRYINPYTLQNQINKAPATQEEIYEAIKLSGQTKLPIYSGGKETGGITTEGMANIPNIDFTIPSSLAQSRQGIYFVSDVKLKSGNLATALYNKKEKKYQPDLQGKHYVIGGKTYTLEEALEQGILEYRPVLSGIGEYSDTDVDILVDPTAYGTPINASEQAIRVYNINLAAQKRLAAEKNAQYKKTTTSTATTKPTTGISGTPKKEQAPQTKKTTVTGGTVR
jgi:hypothetical protein